MARNEQDPVEVKGLMEEDRAFEHPAFGQIQVSRVSGYANLYGSDFPHHAYVVVRIHGSRLNRGLSRESYFNTKTYIEVALTEAQWATFVSSFNSGTGVPCTIQYLKGDGSLPAIPYRDVDQMFKVEADEKLSASVRKLQELYETVDSNTAGLTKKVRAELLNPIRSAIASLTDSLPFVAKQFGEHMEERVEKAKVEIHAHMNHAIQAAGLQALVERGDIKAPLAIEAPEGSE